MDLCSSSRVTSRPIKIRNVTGWQIDPGIIAINDNNVSFPPSKTNKHWNWKTFPISKQPETINETNYEISLFKKNAYQQHRHYWARFNWSCD